MKRTKVGRKIVIFNMVIILVTLLIVPFAVYGAHHVSQVKDSGKGIAEDRQAQIFARFYREPEVHDKGGIGVGLYLTRKILELQGGYIEVRSEIGKGSEFCLYLPNDR